MFSNFSNFGNWNDMYKNQQNMMSFWNNFSENSNQDKGFNWMNFPNFSNLPNFQEYAPQMEKWQEMMKNYDPLKAGEMMSKTSRDVFEKMMDSNSFYLGLYNFWENMSKEFIDPQSAEFKKEIEKMMDNYDTMIMEQFIPLMPEELQGLFMNPYNYIKNITGSYGQFMGPWTDISKSMADAYAEAMLKDPSTVSDVVSLWKEGYDKTFGALMKSPAFGISRDDIEQNSKMVDSLINFLVTSSEFFTNISGVVNDNSKKAFETYFELLQEGTEPKTFNEFYEFWSSKIEEALNEYFYTDEFTKLISVTVDSIMEFKIESDKAVEKLLENLPIVTNSEIDNVYKNVYLLKKEVRSLKDEIEELKETVNVKEEKTKTKNKK